MAVFLARMFGYDSFEKLFNLDDIQQLQDIFAKAIGVGSMIYRPDETH